MEEVNEDGNLDFKWLKKRGVGGKKKEIQFYESFMYDGVEYTLYDCVYMYKEGLQEPYIGKLTKIWERPEKLKKVKVHWFFRPKEISKWLGETKTLENEIFFASGGGEGLANINPLVIKLSNIIFVNYKAYYFHMIQALAAYDHLLEWNGFVMESLQFMNANSELMFGLKPRMDNYVGNYIQHFEI